MLDDGTFTSLCVSSLGFFLLVNVFFHYVVGQVTADNENTSAMLFLFYVGYGKW